MPDPSTGYFPEFSLDAGTLAVDHAGDAAAAIPSREPERMQASASAPTLEQRVREWAAKKAAAGVPANHCVLPFLTGAPRAVECRSCSKIIYAGDEIQCSVKNCPLMFHRNCVVKDTSNFTAESFRCRQHGCMVCKQKMFFWRCGRCTVAAHTKCAAWPVVRLNDDRASAICWKHPSDWLMQNENADFTNSIEEVFCRLPLPYINEDLNMESTISKYAEAVYKPAPYTSIRRNVYLIKKKRTGVRLDIGCTNCRADSTCKEDCECRGLSTSCSKNCRCSDLCTNRPFRKDKKIKIVKTKQCGWGVVALEPLERGDFVIEYVGEVIDGATCEKRLWDIRERGDKTLYMCQISKDFTIDATFKGNISRFLNHSYEPNCRLEKWLVDGETRLGIFASRSIKVGEPLTYDCSYLLFGDIVKCHCEAFNQIKNPAQNALATTPKAKLREYSSTQQETPRLKSTNHLLPWTSSTQQEAPRLKPGNHLLPWANCIEVSVNLKSKRKSSQLCWARKKKRT